MSERTVFVESEYAPLRTVVLARSEFRPFDPAASDPDQLERELSILPADHRAYLLGLAGRDVAEADPDRQRDWDAERESFRAVLERHGVEVLRPRGLTPLEKQAAGAAGYMNAYVRDPWFTVGDVVVEGSLRFPHRRGEVLTSRPLLLERVLEAECAYVATPIPELVPLEVDGGGPGPFLEGGDVLVCGSHVLVGSSGRASTELGARWLGHLLGPRGYTVEPVRLAPNFLHLDCTLGLVREGLAVVFEGAFLDGLPSILDGWDLVPVSQSEAMNLGTNGLPLSPDVYVADPEFARVGEQIERRGVHVEYVDFAISRSFGGAFRCSTQPLWRG
jgi:glycine amidinotransferase